jgi:hypothetical protein
MENDPIDIVKEKDEVTNDFVPPGRLQPIRPPTPYAYVPTRVVPYRRPATYTSWGHPDDNLQMGDVVYFMYSAGRVKIGTSNDVDNRQLSFAAAGPFPPSLILVMRGAVREERALHKQFHDSRLHGEWFAWSDQIQDFLAARLCRVGLATLEKARAEFQQYCSDFLNGHVPMPKRRKVKPRPQCEHGKPLSNKCLDCERNVALARLERLNAHLADPNRDPNALDHEWISQPRKPRNEVQP